MNEVDLLVAKVSVDVLVSMYRLCRHCGHKTNQDNLQRSRMFWVGGSGIQNVSGAETNALFPSDSPMEFGYQIGFGRS